MYFDPDRVRVNVRQATTEDLLDRATVYRSGMEPEALEMIETELNTRGVRFQDIEEHGRQRAREVILLAEGTAARCSFCFDPAVGQGWGWHRLWGVLPVFPRYYFYCAKHSPGGREGVRPGSDPRPPG